MDVDFPTNLGYYAYMIEKEKAMTTKKNPRPILAKPRKVVVNPTPSEENVVYTENLVSLIDMIDAEDHVLSASKDDNSFVVEARDENGSDPLTEYGIYLGYAKNKDFIPEIIIDANGAYVLIFHDISK